MKGKIFIALCLFTGLIFCHKKKVPNYDYLLGLDYFPTDIGRYIIYDVDSTIYLQLPADTISYKYRIKEKITDSFTDNEGQPVLRLERYIKKFNSSKSYDSIPWTIKEVWMINADNKKIQIVESNKRLIKLVFPVETSASWNINASNTQPERNASYEYIDKLEVINNQKLESVLKVNQYFFRTEISLQNYQEKYAKGIGLVYKEATFVVNRKFISLGIPVENRIDSGLVYKQSIVSYGSE